MIKLPVFYDLRKHFIRVVICVFRNKCGLETKATKKTTLLRRTFSTPTSNHFGSRHLTEAPWRKTFPKVAIVPLRVSFPKPSEDELSLLKSSLKCDIWALIHPFFTTFRTARQSALKKNYVPTFFMMIAFGHKILLCGDALPADAQDLHRKTKHWKLIS